MRHTKRRTSRATPPHEEDEMRTRCCFRKAGLARLPFLFFFFFFFFFFFLSCFAFAFDQEENERGASANAFSMTTRTPKLELSSSHSSSSSQALGERRRTFLETNESLVVRARLENGKGYERKVYLKFLLGTTTTSNEEEKFEKMRDDGKRRGFVSRRGVDGERRQKAVAFAEGRREERRPGSHRGFSKSVFVLRGRDRESEFE